MKQLFKGDNHTSCVLEIISNQLQLASRQSWLEKRPNDPHREALERQTEVLRTRIIEQRAQLGIAVDGV
jgi:hypothetical protein